MCFQVVNREGQAHYDIAKELFQTFRDIDNEILGTFAVSHVIGREENM